MEAGVLNSDTATFVVKQKCGSRRKEEMLQVQATGLQILHNILIPKLSLHLAKEYLKDD
jgi:hypothetical protein